MDDTVRWSLKVSRETDEALRAYLGRTGGRKGDLSKFVQQAVQARLRDAGTAPGTATAAKRAHARAGLARALEQIRARGCEIEKMKTSYFLSRDTVIPSIGSGMAPWREKLFAQMHHNASAAADFLTLPNNSVVELGSKIEI